VSINLLQPEHEKLDTGHAPFKFGYKKLGLEDFRVPAIPRCFIDDSDPIAVGLPTTDFRWNNIPETFSFFFPSPCQSKSGPAASPAGLC
jgi:hypothetical protein